ncbi:flavodoxin family protein [Phycicoccus sp. Soil748]|uniref:flavodoxin family protein n=1 Tax=Intrasporangiaceae TaxID=85021 RepID=UPI000702C6DF|nr:flavodoxin family protein [Phycicoccus sp. Soil748]KRE52588.1 flavodoxin [Phycicoccus sp. Soil748]
MGTALVVYESMYGNTGRVAQAIAEGLRDHVDAIVCEVGVAPDTLPDVELLVVGGPTHAFGMSRASTREDAARSAARPVVSGRRGIREWTEALSAPTTQVALATFDTKVARPRLPGSAAHAVARRLRRLGVRQVCPPETFHVQGREGPLSDGELERARAWGQSVARQWRRHGSSELAG